MMLIMFCFTQRDTTHAKYEQLFKGRGGGEEAKGENSWRSALVIQYLARLYG